MNFFGFKWRAYAVLAVLIIFAVSGCKKDDDNPVDPNKDVPGTMSGSITLNGDGFNNKSFSFPAAGSEYNVSDATTTIGMSIASAADSISVGLWFSGNQAGTYNLVEDTEGASVNGVMVVAGTKYYFSSNTGSITVTQYGNVGGVVTGTFQGTLKEVLGDGTVTVSGSFKALRMPDAD